MIDDIQIIQLKDKAFPKLLKEINDPPKQLYVRGDIKAFKNKRFLAVVGSRKASAYGKQCIDNLLPSIARANITIVSGLALGIDSLAHQVAVNAKKPTIAVLGTGIDDTSIYPRAHLKLAHDILKNGGLLVSEYPPKSPVYKGNFPARNRIVTGLCQVTLVIQAAKKSGSLISARLATEYNREVAAIPGPITDSLAEGTNELIQAGAHTILSPEDVLLLFGLHKITPAKEAQLQMKYSKK